MTEQHGIKSRPELPRRVIVRPDEPPTVAFTDPDETTREAVADDVLLAGVVAQDDLAVVAAEVHYAVKRGGSEAVSNSGHTPTKLPGLGTKHVRGDAALDLKPLDLKPGDIITYRIRVLDSLPAPKGPNAAETEERSLTIVEKAEPIATRRSLIERKQLQEMLDEIKKANAENRKETQALRPAAEAAERPSGKWTETQAQNARERETAERQVEEKLHLFAHEASEHPTFAALARPARQIADVEAEAARDQLDQAARAVEAPRRSSTLKQADNSLGVVQNRLEDLQKRFDALAKLEDDRRHLATLAERQDELANRAQDLRPERRSRPRRARPGPQRTEPPQPRAQ